MLERCGAGEAGARHAPQTPLHQPVDEAVLPAEPRVALLDEHLDVAGVLLAVLALLAREASDCDLELREAGR